MTTTSPSRIKIELSFPKPSATEPVVPMPEKDGHETNAGRWTKAEHKLFLEALELYGKDWKKVQQHVGTRTTTQARSHAQKYFAKIGRGNEPLDDSPKPDPQSKCDNSEIPSTAHTYSPAKSVQLDEVIAMATAPKKRLKGPFKPGRRPIKCDPAAAAENPKKRPKKEEPEPSVQEQWVQPPLPLTPLLSFPAAVAIPEPVPNWFQRPPLLPMGGDFVISEPPVPHAPFAEVEFDGVDFEVREPLRLPEQGNAWAEEWSPEAEKEKIGNGDELENFFDERPN